MTSPTPAPPPNFRLPIAEFIGTTVLMIIGPGSAILASDTIGNYGVAFAFGLALLAMAYTIGHVSGCHINPAVTLGFFLTRKLNITQAVYYSVAQFIGAALGGLLIFGVIHGDDKLDQTGVFAANGWGADIGSKFGIGSAILVEIIFTAV